MKAWLKMLGLLLIIVLLVGGYWGFNLLSFINKQKAAGAPKETVTTIVAHKDEWQGNIQAVASLSAKEGADLTMETQGVVEKIFVQSASMVKKGEAILSLRANEERAKLASLKAQAALAVANNKRDLEQFAASAISQAQLDSSTAQKAIAEAAVTEQLAKIAKTTLLAPFNGQIGVMQVSVGQWLSVGSKVVSFQAAEQIQADFNLPQHLAGKLAVGKEIVFKSEALGDQEFRGKVSAIDSRIDTDTRMILVRASVPNQQRKLIPGIFGKVTLNEGGSQSLITLPQTAVVYSPYGESVYVITNAQTLYDKAMTKAKANNAKPEEIATIKPPINPAQKVVEQVFVKTGTRRGTQISVLSGIKEGDEIVSSGQIKLKNGTAVVVSQDNQPANSTNSKITRVD